MPVNQKALTEGSSLLTSGLTRYNRWMVAQLNRLGPLYGTILEFGCGSGGVTRALIELPKIHKVIANDVSPYVKEWFLEKYSDEPLIEYCQENILESPHLFSAMSYDMAVSCNTLEHIQDDVIALRRLVEYARTKTAIILVPALPCLFGTCDQDGGHLRRYTRNSFIKMAIKAELIVDGCFYFNMIGAAAWWMKYVALRQRNYDQPSHGISYSIFDNYVMPWYESVERHVRCPFGLSYVARVRIK